MVWDHWPESWETADLTTYRAGFLTGREAGQWIVDTLSGPEPAAIWGLSDGDTAWWCYDALVRLPEVDRRWCDFLALTSGLHPSDRETLWPLFDAACRNSPHWLVQYHWDIASRFTHAAFMAHGVGIQGDGFQYAGDTKRKVDCDAVCRRLAIVSGQADELAARLLDAEFVRATDGGDITWSVVVKVSCPPGESSQSAALAADAR
jgi:hypothetical protein